MMQTLTQTQAEKASLTSVNKGLLQRRSVDRDEVAEVPPIVHKVLSSPGQSLDSESRTFMESRFGQDFSSVRVHTNDQAAESAQAINALAYTVGQNVVFNTGQYAPKTFTGQQILAHELTHVLQQQHITQGASTAKLHLAQSDSSQEAEANRMADAVTTQKHESLREISSDVSEAVIQRLSLAEGIGVGLGVAAGLVGLGLLAYFLGREHPRIHLETNAANIQLIRDPASTTPEIVGTLPQGTRVVITDDGRNRPFNSHNEQWVKVRVTVGAFLNQEGWLHRNQLVERPETEEISPEAALQIFQALAQANILTNDGSAPIPFHYPPDGCYARAHRMEELLTEMGYASEKVFALAGSLPLRAETDYGQDAPSSQTPGVTWAWHVAPIIKVRDPQRGLLETVLDPSLAERPLLLDEWLDTMEADPDTVNTTFTRLTLGEVREQMQTGQLGRNRRVAVTAPRYTYNPDSLLDTDPTREEAQSSDRSSRPRITRYVQLAPVFELARLIRVELRRAVINLMVILTAIRNATRFVRQQFTTLFARLLEQLRQRLTPPDRQQVDAALDE
ncbi:hypothetical protein NIES2101_12890 [Calothrix sp. HK-06]|nr:hypothetical protein NIES2101_12890 [Calothrix sp. HK-06]